ncbi:MAG: hypothetical protein ACTTJ6_01800 [Treponema sp.]
MVGIFWLFPDLSDLFYVDKIDIQFAQKYSDWLISNEDHCDVWEKLKQSGYLLQCLPKVYREEYWKLPRGRVSYNVPLGKYYVYHGNWFLKKHSEIIEKTFELSKDKVIYEEDEHYFL